MSTIDHLSLETHTSVKRLLLRVDTYRNNG